MNVEATGLNPVEAPKIFFFFLATSQFIALIAIITVMAASSFYLYFHSSYYFILCFIPFMGCHELNKLTCSPCMGLHSSAGRALQRERIGHR